MSRRASHAGSWYSNSGSGLAAELDGWLTAADSNHGPARAIIAPHAGYAYCGACGAHAYKQVNPANIERVFILGPSHHVYLAGCAVSKCNTYETPLYNLQIDQKINEELLETGKFSRMDIATDENEHSIEMHLPYIAKVMESKKGNFTIIPILVGALKADKEREYGKVFSKYLKDPANLFVISSDFCHWGKRFRYTYYDKSFGNIYQSIEALDRQGMAHIEKCDARGFHSYIENTSNTICGRHPIAVLLNAMQALESNNGSTMHMKVLNYAQSNKVRRMDDSSVSYAAASLIIS